MTSTQPETCRHCGDDIEPLRGNLRTPWVHTDTGSWECPALEAEGFHAEPNP